MNESFINNTQTQNGSVLVTTSNPFHKGLKITAITVIDVTALVGNTLVCLSVYKNPRLRSSFGLITLALAICDLTGALVVMPLVAASLILAKHDMPQWITANKLGLVCDIQGFLIYGLTGTSMSIMQLAAINRYLCVVQPNVYRKWCSHKNVALAIAISCLSILGVEAVLFFPGYSKFEFVLQISACMMLFTPTGEHLKVFLEKTVIVLWGGVPILTIGFCYTMVFLTVRKHNRKIGHRLKERRARPRQANISKDTSNGREVDPPGLTERNEADKEQPVEVEEHNPFNASLENHRRIENEKKVRPHNLENQPRNDQIELALAAIRYQQPVIQEEVNQHCQAVVLAQEQGKPNMVDEEQTGVDGYQEMVHDDLSKSADTPDDIEEQASITHTTRLKRVLDRSQKRGNSQLTRVKQGVNEAKVTRTALAVFVGFCVCWIPAIIDIGAGLGEPVLVILCGSLSSAVNPLIYAATNREFRKAYLRLLKCNT